MTSICVSSLTSKNTLDDDGGGDGESSTPFTLYGRQHEAAQALVVSAYQRVLDTKRSHVVVVHGAPGSGKTFLVDSLRQPVCQARGYFTSGKFSQSAVQDPYSAIMAAFSELCEHVQNETDEFERRRLEIKQALGVDGAILSRAISGLAPFLDVDDTGFAETVPDIKHEAVVAKFKGACRTLLHALSLESHPVVMFIDDIQWMDTGSTNLIRLLLQDMELQHVLFVLTYRDDECHPTILDLVHSIEDRVDILLANMDVDGVRQMVCGILQSESNLITAFSDLVHQKTGGNPYHVQQLVELLRRDKLIVFDTELQSWQCDLEQIQREIMVSDTLASVLTRKIQSLSVDVQRILEVASLVGYFFEESTLMPIIAALQQGDCEEMKEGVAVSVITVEASLRAAVSSGIIERMKEGFNFRHDTIQAAFRNMIVDEGKLHAMISTAFLAQGGEESVYQAMVHLNLAPKVQYDNDEQLVEIVNYYLQASRYCQHKCAFTNAADFLRSGLELLGGSDGKWIKHLTLVLTLTEALARLFPNYLTMDGTTNTSSIL